MSGNFDTLFTRVSKVHLSKAGPFHALFCLGRFGGRKGFTELKDYIQGSKLGQRVRVEDDDG